MGYVGQNIGGYEVIAELGQGAQSTIYAVQDRGGRRFALKRIESKGSDDQRFIARAHNELEVSGKVDHPVLRKCLKVMRERSLLRTDALLVLMELVEGVTLEDQRPTDLLETVRIAQQVASALIAMHEVGCVHADIKPCNIMLTRQGQVKVIDFGHSCVDGQVNSGVQGTPAFMAPEQLRGREKITARTDVYNFGATLYWLVTGQHVWPAASVTDDGLAIGQQKEYVPPQQLNPKLPTSLALLISNCVRAEPAERPRSMLQVLETLQMVEKQMRRLSQGPVALPPPGETGVYQAVEAPDASEASARQQSRPPMKVLLVEPDVQTQRMVTAALGACRTQRFETFHVGTLADALAWLDKQRADVVLSEVSLPDATGQDVVNALCDHARRVAVVILSAVNDRSLILRSLSLGAQDYVLKEDLHGSLPPRILIHAHRRSRMQSHIVEKALEYVRHAQALKQRVRRLEAKIKPLQQVFDLLPDAALIVAGNGTVLQANAAAQQLLGRSQEQLVGQLLPFELNREPASVATIAARGQGLMTVETRCVPLDWPEQPAALVTLREKPASRVAM